MFVGSVHLTSRRTRRTVSKVLTDLKNANFAKVEIPFMCAVMSGRIKKTPFIIILFVQLHGSFVISLAKIFNPISK